MMTIKKYSLKRKQEGLRKNPSKDTAFSSRRSYQKTKKVISCNDKKRYRTSHL